MTKLIKLVMSVTLLIALLSACSGADEDYTKLSYDEMTEKLVLANSGDSIFAGHDVYVAANVDENGDKLWTRTYAKLSDGTLALFEHRIEAGTHTAIFPDAYYLEHESVPYMMLTATDTGYTENYDEMIALVRLDVEEDEEIISVEKSGDNFVFVYEIPHTSETYKNLGLDMDSGIFRVIIVADAKTLEMVEVTNYHIAEDGGKKFLRGMKFEYDIPFTEPEFSLQCKEMAANPDGIFTVKLIIDPETSDEMRREIEVPTGMAYWVDGYEMFADAAFTEEHVGYPSDTAGEITIYVKSN
ncbi:MAG: hypothetical protein FWG69_00795 [Oscillospiraceae bacterium]|nr:hypothetical protein [Oscillospiraceae bacterium]